MPSKALNIRVSTPAGEIPRGRGFYQVEEEELHVPVEYPPLRTRFYSFLDSETLSLHLDREGRLIFIEIPLPVRQWKVRGNLVSPERAEPANIRFLDFREIIESPPVFCDPTRENVMIRFSRSASTRNVYLAENVIAQTNADCQLNAIWISDIVGDFAGRGLAAWRRMIHRLSPVV
ncbi:MAG: hypothetical protein JSU69_05535, partial [Candidatus Zixiibacteriota bacterium]